MPFSPTFDIRSATASSSQTIPPANEGGDADGGGGSHQLMLDSEDLMEASRHQDGGATLDNTGSAGTGDSGAGIAPVVANSTAPGNPATTASSPSGQSPLLRLWSPPPASRPPPDSSAACASIEGAIKAAVTPRTSPSAQQILSRSDSLDAGAGPRIGRDSPRRDSHCRDPLATTPRMGASKRLFSPSSLSSSASARKPAQTHETNRNRLALNLSQIAKQTQVQPSRSPRRTDSAVFQRLASSHTASSQARLEAGSPGRGLPGRGSLRAPVAQR